MSTAINSSRKVFRYVGQSADSRPNFTFTKSHRVTFSPPKFVCQNLYSLPSTRSNIAALFARNVKKSLTPGKVTRSPRSSSLKPSFTCEVKKRAKSRCSHSPKPGFLQEFIVDSKRKFFHERLRRISPGIKNFTAAPAEINDKKTKSKSHRADAAKVERFQDSEVATGTFVSTPGPGSYVIHSIFDMVERKIIKFDRHGKKRCLTIKKPINSRAPRYTSPKVKRSQLKKDTRPSSPGPGTYEIPSGFKLLNVKTLLGKNAVKKRETVAITAQSETYDSTLSKPIVEYFKTAIPEAKEESKDQSEIITETFVMENPDTIILESNIDTTQNAKNEPSTDILKDLLSENKSTIIESPAVPLRLKNSDSNPPSTNKRLILSPPPAPPKPPSNFLIFLNIFLSVALLVGAVGYFILAYVAAFDKKGKEAYFIEDPLERTLQEAVKMKLVHPDWTIMTDDWGYFQRAYQEIKSGESNRWKNYDVFIGICVTSVLVSVFWIAAGGMEIAKFVKTKLELGCYGIVLNLLGLVAYGFGNLFIVSRIYTYNENFQKLWDYCNCPEFKENFYTSITIYLYTTGIIGCLAILQLPFSIILCCKRVK